MYATEPCVKFPCNRCAAWVTAAQSASSIVCPRCETEQSVDYDRMRHFSLKGNLVLFDTDEWLDGNAGEATLQRELDVVQRLLDRLPRTDTAQPESFAGILTDQTRAIAAAIALCRRQATR